VIAQYEINFFRVKSSLKKQNSNIRISEYLKYAKTYVNIHFFSIQKSMISLSNKNIFSF